MNTLLSWIIPPLVGAFIGYITNVVAIKMLFRPLKEIRFFGFRLPFTPGILPRERHKLADSIGSMVERELITPGVLKERLARPEVREKMENSLGSYTEQILERPLSSLLEDKPGDFPLSELLKDFVNSVVFDSYLEELLAIWAGLKTPSPDDDGNSLGSWVKSKVRNVGVMFVPAARNLIKGGLVKQINSQVQGEPSLYRQALEKLMEKYPGITLREFLSLGKAKKKRIDYFIVDKAVTTLDENIDGTLSSVNVKVLVSDRINSLDMIRVEKIILDVMADQLKWINVFGGILGALIGFVQVILNIFI